MLSRSHCPAPEKYPRSSTLFHSHTSCPDKKLCEEAQFSPPVAVVQDREGESFYQLARLDCVAWWFQ